MVDRRQILQSVGSAIALGASGLLARAAGAAEKVPLVSGLPSGVYDTATLEALPGKKPLIKLSYRPPNYETPASYFAAPITPNEAFFVRYHLADIPAAIDVNSWTLRVGGDGATGALEFGMRELQGGFEQVEIAAVCQCSGNRRDYIRTNSPFMTAKVWEAEVTKMINAFGAPIEPADAKAIIDYLARNYGSP